MDPGIIIVAANKTGRDDLMPKEKIIQHKMEIITDIKTIMRDGTVLYGDLYKPQGEGKFPAILLRYIFKKENLARNWEIYEPFHFVKAGYAVFIQDVRGTGKSEGELRRFTADGLDGYDTIEWMAEQPWCDGNVGMMGNFYSGFLQFAAAAERPPHLRCICPFQTSVTLNRHNNTRGFMFASHIGWCLSRIIDRMKDGWYDEKTTAKYLPILQEYFDEYPKQVAYRPLKDMPAAQIKEFPLLTEYLDHVILNYDNLDYIHKEGKDMDLSRIEVPVFCCAGWMDTTSNAIIDQHIELVEKGEGLGKNSSILIGPWIAGASMTTDGIELDLGKGTSGYEVGVTERMIEWFNKWMKNTNEYQYAPITLFVMGKNIWRQEHEWPLARTVYKNLYLHSDGNANTRFGDGRLNFDKPEHHEPSDVYMHNPEKPILSQAMGKDARKLEERPDILVYTSEAMEADVEVTGLLEAVLYVSSSAPDTDFMVKVLDVLPDGRAIALSEGATRARYRNSWTPELLEKGKVYKIHVKAGYLSHTFLRGHRIRIEVASSNFMLFDINQNTGVRPGEDPDIEIAVNTIHHRPGAESMLILPVIPE